MKNKILLALALLPLFYCSTEGQCFQCDSNSISGTYSAAFGYNNTGSGMKSFVSGEKSEIAGTCSFAAGYESKALANLSFALGTNSEANGNQSIAFGSYAKTFEFRSIAIGSYISVIVPRSIVIGEGYGPDHPLKNYIQESFMVGFYSDSATFFVGRSPGPWAGTTGRVGIGTSHPKAKLDIRSDEGEEAVLLVEPHDWQLRSTASLQLGNNNYGMQASYLWGLSFKTESNYVFSEGNVGIGTDMPAAKLQVSSGDIFISDINYGIIMKSPDGQCWRGTLNNQGQLEFSQVNCPEFTTGVPENEEGQNILHIYPNPADKDMMYRIESMNQQGNRLDLLTINGQIVKSFDVVNDIGHIELQDISSGIYFVALVDKDGRIIDKQKLVVK